MQWNPQMIENTPNAFNPQCSINSTISGGTKIYKWSFLKKKEILNNKCNPNRARKTPTWTTFYLSVSQGNYSHGAFNSLSQDVAKMCRKSMCKVLGQEGIGGLARNSVYLAATVLYILLHNLLEMMIPSN